jgi:hypothetical protein
MPFLGAPSRPMVSTTKRSAAGFLMAGEMNAIHPAGARHPQETSS